MLRSSSESVSRSPGWSRVPELYGVDPAGPGAGEEGSGVGACAGVCSVEHPWVLPDLVVLLSRRSAILNVAPEPGTSFPAAPASN